MQMINQEKSVSFAGEKTKKRQENKKQAITNEIGWVSVYSTLQNFHGQVITTLSQR
jgi:hypothetical protein